MERRPRVIATGGKMQKHAIEACGLTRRFGAQLAVDDLNLLASEDKDSLAAPKSVAAVQSFQRSAMEYHIYCMDEYDKELLWLLQTDNLKTGYASILNATTPLWGALVAWLWLRNRLSGS